MEMVSAEFWFPDVCSLSSASLCRCVRRGLYHAYAQAGGSGFGGQKFRSLLSLKKLDPY